MPTIPTDRIGVAFDMRGCPNRCRHCWLGPAGRRIYSTAGDLVSLYRARDCESEWQNRCWL